MEAIPEVQGPVRPPKGLTVTPPQAMWDPSGPRGKSGSCQRGRGKERAASSVVSVSHSGPAATFPVSGTLENGQGVAFIPGSFPSRQEKRHRIKEEVGRKRTYPSSQELRVLAKMKPGDRERRPSYSARPNGTGSFEACAGASTPGVHLSEPHAEDYTCQSSSACTPRHTRCITTGNVQGGRAEAGRGKLLLAWEDG